MPKLELVLETTESGCIVPTSHALNHDGYFRKWVNGELVMYHRHTWEVEHGKIPEGYEVDHKCKNRACCNVLHLQMLTNLEHTVKDNKGRHESKREQARALVKLHPSASMTWIGEQIGISFGTVCKWRREGII